ncbi:MAG: sulfotransferase [Arenicellales bacterium]|nr:sulfotransferase [Arenicellales bacterium]
MALKVIGTGFGRTGTNSLKLALELLGFGPCHHMFEVRDNPSQLPFWQQAARGEMPDWDEVFAEYTACVDWPSVRYWRELCAHFPDAKVVHSVRAEQSWIKSVHKTIYPAMAQRHNVDSGPYRDRLEMAHEIIVNQTFAGRMDDPKHALAVYRSHNNEVAQTIPFDRLLVYEVKEGWEPLCRFLDVPIPDESFPRVNTSSEFHRRPLEATSLK